MTRSKQSGLAKIRRTCFISSQFRSKTTIIVKRALEKLGYGVIVPSEYSSPVPLSVVETVTRMMSEADVVVAILDPEESSSIVFYEVGLAQGLGKPVIVVGPEKPTYIPRVISALPFVRFSQLDSEALQFVTQQFSAAEKSPLIRHDIIPKKTRALHQKGKKLLNQLDTSGTEIAPVELEQLIRKAIQQSGISVSAQSPTRDFGIDLAIWVDELQSLVGNPILIEVKKNLRVPGDIEGITERMLSHLKASDSRLGLLIYLDAPPKVASRLLATERYHSYGPLVLYIQARDFLERLQKNSLADVIRNLRNQLVHGVNLNG